MMHADTGRALWFAIHNYAELIKDEQRQREVFALWVKDVELTIGCKSCFKKLERFMKLWPVAYGEGLYLWSICLHDFVNKELGRKLFYPELTLAPLMQKGIIQ